MNRPVELIITERMHNAAQRVEQAAGQDAAGTADAIAKPTFAEALARQLLCDVAHKASVPRVLEALAAIGGPSTPAEVMARLDAAREAQRREAGGAHVEG
jgi:hypothetical protein